MDLDVQLKRKFDGDVGTLSSNNEGHIRIVIGSQKSVGF